MINGAHSIIYSSDPAADRAFLRDVLELTHGSVILPKAFDLEPMLDANGQVERLVLLAEYETGRLDTGGASWRELAVGFAEQCVFIGQPRVTQVLFDPVQPETIWAGVEIDGVHRSADGGESWRKVSDGLVSEDIHGLAVVENGAHTLFATTNKGLHASADMGESWRHQKLDSPWQYTRAIQPRADGAGTLFLANGNGPPGSTGRLLRSRDFGATWQDSGLPGTLNSTPWCVATNPADADLVFVCTNLGQLFRSTDGGEGWTKLAREFGEVRALLWQPA